MGFATSLRRIVATMCMAILGTGSAAIAQELTVQGDTLHIPAGAVMAIPGGVDLTGSSAVLSIAEGFSFHATSPFSDRILHTSADATSWVSGVAQDETAIFQSTVANSLNANALSLARLAVTNRSAATAGYSLKIDEGAVSGKIALPVEWSLGKSASGSSDVNTLVFTWDSNLEPTTITNKALHLWNAGTSQWNVLSSGVTFSGSSATLANHAGDLSAARFIIASTSNSAATAIALSSSYVSAGNAIGDAVATLSTTDPDGGDAHTYSLASGIGDTDNAQFTIDGSTLKAGVVFDFNSQTVFNVRIRTTDIGGLTFERTFTLYANTLPLVTTTSVSDITSRTATFAADVTASGATAITARGAEISLRSDFSGATQSAEGGTATGAFTHSLAGLTPDTTIYVRAYVTNGAGTTYGDTLSFITGSGGTVIRAAANGFRLLASPEDDVTLDDLLRPLWTQGMTGADSPTGSANVWTYDGAAWIAATNLTTQTLDAGQGVMVYVFRDVDFDGTPDMDATTGVTLSVNGPENINTLSASGLTWGGNAGIGAASYGWHLLGNPYPFPIDIESLDLDAGQSNDGFNATFYLYDPAGPTWLTLQPDGNDDGAGDLIAPYQGFLIKRTSDPGGTYTFDFPAAAKQIATSTFYKPVDSTAAPASVTFTLRSGDREDQARLRFSDEGRMDADRLDAYKLLPLDSRERLAIMTLGPSDAFDRGPFQVQHLPWPSDGDAAGQPSWFDLPLEMLALAASTDHGNAGLAMAAEEVEFSWDLSALTSRGIVVDLHGSALDAPVRLDEQGSMTLMTTAGPYPSTAGLTVYPVRNDHPYRLLVRHAGTTTPIDAPSDDLGLPSRLDLHQNYPNPFNPSTTLRFGLPAHSRDVSLVIHDILGRTVAAPLRRATLQAGWHEVTVDASAWSSGLYFYTLSSSGSHLTRRMTLIK